MYKQISTNSERSLLFNKMTFDLIKIGLYSPYVFMTISPILFMVPLIGEAFNKDPDYSYVDEDAGTICKNTSDENKRIQYFTLLALVTYVICVILANVRSNSYVNEYLDRNENLSIATIFLYVISGMLYPMALTILGSNYTWGLSCNSFDDTNSDGTTTLLWASLLLWLFSTAVLHASRNDPTFMYSIVAGTELTFMGN